MAAWILRRTLAKSLLRLVLRLLYRVEVEGLEHARAAHAAGGDRRQSRLVPRRPAARRVPAWRSDLRRRHADREAVVGAGRSSLFVNALPVDPTNPLSIRAMIRAVEAGSACIIFPEGRITTTGSLMKVYEGPAVIAERTKAALLPVRIDGVEFTPFSRLAGKVRRRLFPRDSHPHPAAARADRARGRDRPRASRRAAPRARATRWCSRCSRPRRIDTTLFDALLEARQQHGGSHVDRRRPRDAAADLPRADHRQLRARRACWRARTRAGERVGVLLPTSRASLVTFFALQADGRVPAMLNFSTGPASAIAACRGRGDQR